MNEQSVMCPVSRTETGRIGREQSNSHDAATILVDVVTTLTQKHW